jgi:hypothetical protein
VREGCWLVVCVCVCVDRRQRHGRECARGVSRGQEVEALRVTVTGHSRPQQLLKEE